MQHLRDPAEFFLCYSETRGFVFTTSRQEEIKGVEADKSPHRLTVSRLHCVPSMEQLEQDGNSSGMVDSAWWSFV